jgi:hypothetical protein
LLSQLTHPQIPFHHPHKFSHTLHNLSRQSNIYHPLLCIAMGYTFSPEESRALEEAGIFIGPSTNGWRKVNASILYLAYPAGISQTSAALSSVTIGYVNRASKPASKPHIDLPEAEHSAAALEFMGFTRPAAEAIFKR